MPTGRQGRRYKNWDPDGSYQKRGNERQLTSLENSYTPEYNDIDDNIVETDDGGFYHGVRDNFEKQIGELGENTSPHHPPPGISLNRDFLEEDYEATIKKQQQSWDFRGRPNDHAPQGGFGNKLAKKRQPYVNEISHSDSGHGAYLDKFDPSPEQGTGGFDPLFRPSTRDPRHAASYKGRSTKGSNAGSKYSGLSGKERPNYPYDLSSRGKHSTTGGGIDWGSWGPESAFESSSEFVDQHDGLKDHSKDYDYSAFDVDSGYKVQPDVHGEDFGNEIYYDEKKDQSSNGRGVQDTDPVPHFDFDQFHRSAGSWF